MHFDPATGKLTFPDFAQIARERERVDLLRCNIDLAIMRTDTHVRALQVLYGGPSHRPRAVELRTAEATSVDAHTRIITVIAVPYDTGTEVLHRDEWWRESFDRNAFRGIEQQAGQIRVNRNHDKSRTVGNIVRFDAHHHAGLLSEVRIARTPLGDETLALADDDCLSASVGFTVPVNGVIQNRSQMTRRITRANLDHLALVESPAYSDAKIVGVA